MRPIFALCAASLLCLAQTAEVTTKDAPVTFTAGTNLVPVTVVVRDRNGRAVGNLDREDFQLLDNGKPQMISKFAVEKISKDADAKAVPQSQKRASDGSALTDAESDGIPDRFVAYLIDDLHLSQGDLVHTREAAKRQIDAGLGPLTREAIYTTSGAQAQEFTADRNKLHTALDAINTSRAAMTSSLNQNACPPLDYYMADRIYNKHDLEMWRIATEDVNYFCPPTTPPPPTPTAAIILQCEASGSSDANCKSASIAKMAARIAAEAGDRNTNDALDALKAVVSRMAAMPGQRSIVVVSPGFLVLENGHDQETAIVNRAIKANVVIGGLDARGLYSSIQGGDASSARVNSKTISEKTPYVNLATIMQTDVVANLADGTGGTFYHGTNDYDEAFTRVAASPDYIYVLSFSPANLKLDGKFHTLKVTLKTQKGLDLQVRKGYYAPKAATDAASQAQQQIEEAVFSRDEIHDLPAVLQTQFFKTPDGEATLSAVAKVDIRKLSYHKEGDRNRNDLTVITGLFDNDGNYMSGAQKIVEMRLLDETLEKRAGSGISVKNNFSVHPGRYVIRMVVRDSEGKLMAAQSSLVEIP